MKKVFSITGRVKYQVNGLVLCLLLIFMVALPSAFLQAQETETEQEVTEEVEEESGLVTPGMNLITIQKSDGSVVLKASLNARIEGSMTRLWGLKVLFSQVTADGDILLGEAITDRKGVGSLEVKETAIKVGPDGMLEFKSVYGGNKSLDPTESSVTITRARLMAAATTDDSLYKITLHVKELLQGAEKPVEGVDVSIFVKRMFAPLKIGEGSTDEDGVAEVEIENGISGDTAGNITLIARIEENETYGTLEATIEENWGVPISEKIAGMPRELWSHNPPIWMLITFIVLMLTVWGHYMVIVYELFKLRKDTV